MQEKITAPWTEDTVEKLNEFQHRAMYHPYTCGNDSSHILIASRQGWYCPYCDYTQDWVQIIR